MGEKTGANRLLVGKPEERGHWGDSDVDEKIILICRNRAFYV
jgi:hypothetical protein